MNVTHHVSCVKWTIALKWTKPSNVPVVIWTTTPINATNSMRKYFNTKKGQRKDILVDLPNGRSGGNVPHVTK